MTEDMVERVAKAICTANGEEHFEDNGFPEWRKYLPDARAALEALPIGELRIALVQAAVPLEGLLASREWADLTPETWAEIENGVKHIRAALSRTRTALGDGEPEEAVLCLSWREDGGLRIHSPTHPGLVLSHSRPDLVMLDVLPVLAAMGFAPPTPLVVAEKNDG